ncbi:MAG: thiol:disulfide interchange protein DsbA/DsbL [Nevskia sp.]|nr:thiol:disulfide interchange protein DsbA/DsbL [Nevskia sp.]
MFKRLIVALTLICCAGAAAAQDKWIEGKHYFRLAQTQPTSTPGRIEVLDVFSYACPACNAFQPTLDKLQAALPPEAQMAYLPAAFNPSEDWPVFQRAFLAARELGVSEKSHDAMYQAVWGKSGSLPITDKLTGRLLPQSAQPTIETVAGFYTAYGVKEQDFLAMARSFTVDAKIRQAEAQMLADQVDSTPTLIVNGKYRVTPSAAGGYAQTIELVQYLVAREKGGK